MIAREKRSHNIGETFIKPCMLKADGLVLGKTYSKTMAKTSLSESMIKTPIDELAKDMECQVFKKLQSISCSIQCDETVDNDQMWRLLACVRFN